MGYKHDVVKGVSWVAAIRVATRILSIVKIIIIARILAPSQFGVFGIAMLLLTLIEILTETGINIFLVQQKDDIDDYVNTAWIVSIFRGVIIGCVILALAGLTSSFFNTPQAYGVLLLSSIIPVIRGFINPSVAKLQKELLFRRQFYYQTILLFVETIVAVLLVIVMKSVNALILGIMAGAIFEVIVSFLIISPMPHLGFRMSLFKNILNHGKWITGSTIFNYFYQHGDDIAVGRILGSYSLGLYDMAYRMSLAPLSDFADVVAKVTFPVYVRMSQDKKRLRKAFFKTLIVVAIVVFPTGVFLSLFAKEIILIVLGSEWINMTPALQVLGIFGSIRAISVFTSTVFLSIQKQNIFMLISLIGLLGLGITIIPFTHLWGISGASASALLGTSITLPVIYYFIRKHIYS